MKRLILAVLAALAMGVIACGGNPCEKLIKLHCEEKKNEQLCKQFTDMVNGGMSKEACEATLKQAK